MNCKLYIGCVSKNTIDAVIEYSNENNIVLGLIPSRRQVDFDGGYINHTNKSLYDYVRSKSDNVILQRDHGGPSQGKKIDDGIISLLDDCKYYDLLHIDPWKQYSDLDVGLQKTKELIELCISNNYKGQFEIATEQSIREFNVKEVEYLIQKLKQYPLKYIVIQSGTSLKENINTGVYDEHRLIEFCRLASSHNYLSKEHNGDYIDNNLIKSKFSNGLDAINIAPEFGLIETNCYLDKIKSNKKLLDLFYQLCYDSNQWKKWVNKDFDINNKINLIQICGHYVLESKIFKEEIISKMQDLTFSIRTKMKLKIKNILE